LVISVVVFIAGQVLADAARSTPWLAGVTRDSVYVSLEATGTADATVYYGLTDSYGSTATSENYQAAGSNYVHNVKLTSLSPNTLYHYQVEHGATTSADYTFYTAPDAGTSVTWGFAADSRSYPSTHNTMAGRIATHQPRMMVYGGDLCNTSSYSSWNNEWFVANQNTLNATSPFVNAPGNHEDWNALTQAFTQSPTGDPAYFSFDYGDAHIVIINNEISDSPGSAQANWVDLDLSLTSKKWKIVAFHKSAYAAGGHGNNADMVSMTTNIFEPRGVDFVLTGHSHFYQHNLVNGIHHMVLGSFGAPLADPGSQSWTVYSEKTYNFGIFDMTPNLLTLRAYRGNGTLMETIVIPEPASLSLLAVGALALIRRRRKSAR
jgi:predicted phosphodiesterase